LLKRAEPYSIPEDYIAFLENYGGLSIEGDDYRFSILGAGPMVEDWYASIESDQAILPIGNYGLLTLGALRFRSGHKYESLNPLQIL
jgi:hypothetical protein